MFLNIHTGLLKAGNEVSLEQQTEKHHQDLHRCSQLEKTQRLHPLLIACRHSCRGEHDDVSDCCIVPSCWLPPVSEGHLAFSASRLAKQARPWIPMQEDRHLKASSNLKISFLWCLCKSTSVEIPGHCNNCKYAPVLSFPKTSRLFWEAKLCKVKKRM